METKAEDNNQTDGDKKDDRAMLSPEQEELQAASRALRERGDPSSPLPYDMIKRLNRARAAAYRKENREKYFDQWLTNFARWLDRDRESIRLLSIDETLRVYDDLERLWKLKDQGLVPYFNEHFPLSAVALVTKHLEMLIRDVPETPVALLGHRTIDFGAIVSTSTEVFRQAITILGDRDYASIIAIPQDKSSGFRLFLQRDPAARTPYEDIPPVYRIAVWGNWAGLMQSREEGQ